MPFVANLQSITRNGNDPVEMDLARIGPRPTRNHNASMEFPAGKQRYPLGKHTLARHYRFLPC